MPLSNYLPSSRLIQPGVCTYLTRPASPFEGMVIYETDTNKTYVWNGSAWIMQVSADTPPGLELIKTQTIIGGPGTIAVTVSDVFSATYDSYLITLTDSTASNHTAMRMRVGSKTTNYYYSLSYSTYSSTATAVSSTNSPYWYYLQGIVASTKFSMYIPIHAPYLAQPTRVGPCQYSDAGAAGVMNGYDATTSQHTSFELSPEAGTISGGTIRVYGYRNSI